MNTCIIDKKCKSISNNMLFFFLVIGTYALSMSVFWIANFFLLIIEITKWPQFLTKYKIQEDPITEASEITEE